MKSTQEDNQRHIPHGLRDNSKYTSKHLGSTSYVPDVFLKLIYVSMFV